MIALVTPRLIRVGVFGAGPGVETEGADQSRPSGLVPGALPRELHSHYVRAGVGYAPWSAHSARVHTPAAQMPTTVRSIFRWSRSVAPRAPIRSVPTTRRRPPTLAGCEVEHAAAVRRNTAIISIASLVRYVTGRIVMPFDGDDDGFTALLVEPGRRETPRDEHCKNHRKSDAHLTVPLR